MKQKKMRHMTLLGVMVTFLAVGGGVIGFASVADAAPVLTVTPNTGLASGTVVSVSGTGFSASGVGAIVECNDAPGQPTILVAGTEQVDVGCSNPLTAVHGTNASGDLPATNFTILSPVAGPPASGTDSNGNPASTDAALYPCPPTQAQINQGDTCTLGYGTSGGASASSNITFQGQPLPKTSVTSVSPNAGPLAGGTVVTIMGESLSSPTAVSFGGVAATSFTGVSATEVTAVAPASATSQTVDVQVTTGFGQSPANPPGDSFTYTKAPLVYAISPTSGPPAGGTSVTLTGAQYTGTTAVDFGSTPATSFKVNSDASVTATAPAGTGTVDVTATNAFGKSVTSPADQFTYQSGYRLVGSDGGVFTYGPLTYEGSAGGTHLNAPIVGMASTPDGKGYWLVASDGGVFSYGDAVFYGSAGGTVLNKPIVGIAATADGGGYWLVASDGGVFSYGDAVFHGSAGGITLNKPIVGIAATSDGGGYWLVASDGGVFSYGDAVFYGSAGGTVLNKPIVGIAATADGGGYWLAAADGGVFSYGDAVFQGSAGSLSLNKPVVGIAATADGGGYWLVASDGGIFNYGDATFFGSAGGTTLNAPIVGMSVSG